MATEFRFNFAADDDDEDDAMEVEGEAVVEEIQTNPTLQEARSTPIAVELPRSQFMNVFAAAPWKSLIMRSKVDVVSVSPDISLSRRNAVEIEQTMSSASRTVSLTQQNHSDLISGVYEGGFKTWECSIDLVRFLHAHASSLFAIPRQRVLELGCGSGLPGIYALVHGGSLVDFQDFNGEVIGEITSFNVARNLLASPPFVSMSSASVEDLATAPCRFIAGDWSTLTDCLGADAQYSLILSAETVYNPASYDVLLRLLRRHLAPGGAALFAAKEYYFGVGGGIKDFAEAAETFGEFRAQYVWTTEQGLRRHIVRVTRV